MFSQIHSFSKTFSLTSVQVSTKTATETAEGNPKRTIDAWKPEFSLRPLGKRGKEACQVISFQDFIESVN